MAQFRKAIDTSATYWQQRQKGAFNNSINTCIAVQAGRPNIINNKKKIMNQFVKSITTGVMAAFIFMSAPAMSAETFNESIVHKTRENEETKSFDIKIVQRRNTESVVLYILKQEGKKLSIELYSPDGTIIEKYVAGKKGTGVNRFYNFKNAEEGVYVFKISDGNREIIRKLTLERFATATTPQVVIL